MVAGRPILERSVAVFLSHPDIDEIVVALPTDLAADPPAYLKNVSKPVRIVVGGARRRDSVSHAFGVVDAQAEVVGFTTRRGRSRAPT